MFSACFLLLSLSLSLFTNRSLNRFEWVYSCRQFLRVCVRVCVCVLYIYPSISISICVCSIYAYEHTYANNEQRVFISYTIFGAHRIHTRWIRWIMSFGSDMTKMRLIRLVAWFLHELALMMQNCHPRALPRQTLSQAPLCHHSTEAVQGPMSGNMSVSSLVQHDQTQTQFRSPSPTAT